MTVLRLADAQVSEEIRERLRLAIDAIDSIPKHHGRTAAVANLLEEGHQTVRLWLADGVTKKAGLPNLTRIANLTEKLGVNTEWFIDGTGPMSRADNPDDNEVQDSALSAMFEFICDQNLMGSLDGIDREHRNWAMRHIYETVLIHGYTREEVSKKEAKIYNMEKETVKKFIKNGVTS